MLKVWQHLLHLQQIMRGAHREFNQCHHLCKQITIQIGPHQTSLIWVESIQNRRKEEKDLDLITQKRQVGAAALVCLEVERKNSLFFLKFKKFRMNNFLSVLRTINRQKVKLEIKRNI